MKKYLFLLASLVIAGLFVIGITNYFKTTLQGAVLFVGILVFTIKSGYHFSYGEDSFKEKEIWYLPLFFMFLSIGTSKWDSNIFLVEMVEYFSIYFLIGSFFVALLSKSLSPKKGHFETRIERKKSY